MQKMATAGNYRTFVMGCQTTIPNKCQLESGIEHDE